MHRSNSRSLDHLVGEGKQSVGHRQANCFRSLHVDNHSAQKPAGGRTEMRLRAEFAAKLNHARSTLCSRNPRPCHEFRTERTAAEIVVDVVGQVLKALRGDDADRSGVIDLPDFRRSRAA